MWSQVITTTLEADFQDGVQQAIAGMTGASSSWSEIPAASWRWLCARIRSQRLQDPRTLTGRHYWADRQQSNQPLYERATV